MMDKINVAEKLNSFSEHFTPKVIAEVNGQSLKVVKALGEFVWHTHDDDDELFWVISGNLKMCFRDRDVMVGPGEMIVVPKGVEHKPVAEEEVEVVLIEPADLLNTGDATSDLTVHHPERI
jgi:mannose-6-phosphate isomerase-like protein (cupin superfamily)